MVGFDSFLQRLGVDTWTNMDARRMTNGDRGIKSSTARLNEDSLSLPKKKECIIDRRY